MRVSPNQSSDRHQVQIFSDFDIWAFAYTQSLSAVKEETNESFSETAPNCCFDEPHFEQHSSPCNSEAVVPQFEPDQQVVHQSCAAVSGQPKQLLDDVYKTSWAGDLDVSWTGLCPAGGVLRHHQGFWSRVPKQS